jgi:hypothetical protein
MTKPLIALLFTALVLLNSTIPTFGSPGQAMTKPQVETLLSAGNLNLVESKAEIPQVWWKAMSLNEMADVGGDFDPGCTGSAPHMRLIFAAISDTHAALISEHGGIAHWNVLAIFKKENGTVNRVYSETGLTEARMSALRKKLGN